MVQLTGLTSQFLLLQGTSAESNLLAGGARAVHWSDVTQKSLRLCIRLQETGQQWSGGFALDTPGDLFVKIRHRYMSLFAGSAMPH